MKRSSKASTGAKKTLSVVAQPNEFFKQRVSKALKNQKVEADPHTEFYLVNLLTRFMKAENLFTVDESGGFREEVLAILLGKALTSPDPGKKQEDLRRLGDISLYTAGFFPDRLSRKVVDIDYYIGMGRNAYSSLAQIGFDAFVRKVFLELSSSFHKFVDVLAEISEEGGTKNATNILRLYEVWLKTRSERTEKQLKEAGILPNSLLKPDWQ